ncbi:MAG: peptidylprolyl isomerase [Mariprofundaceae bacterium]|nr:peptidylprolyl isomerase [Mariprofundaceae bacterium]
MRLPLLCLLIIMAACQQQNETLPIEEAETGPAVATIGNHVLYESDIDAEMDALPDSLRHLRSDPRARAEVLQSLIRRQILSQRARELGLDTEPGIHQQIIRARDTILIHALEEWQLNHIPRPTGTEIAAYYKEHPEKFTIPEQIHARHILVASEKKAWEILKSLRRKKADFASLAATYSLDDSNKSRGGDLNWFSRGIMVRPFEDAAFALKQPGSISKPVKTQFGWHIIELLGKRPASRKSLEEAREEIVNILQQQSLSSWVERLTAQANVQLLRPEYEPLAK